MKGLAELAKQAGFDQASIAYECLKVALASEIRILAIFEKAETDFQLKLGFSFLKKAAKQVPDIRSQEDLGRYLPRSTHPLKGAKE